MRNLIQDLKQNHTVLISSHILTEISQTCDRLLVLGKGKLLGAGSEHELAASEGEIRAVTVTVRPPAGDDPKGKIAKVLERDRGRHRGRRAVRAGRRAVVRAVDDARTAAPRSAARSSRPSSI